MIKAVIMNADCAHCYVRSHLPFPDIAVVFYSRLGGLVGLRSKVKRSEKQSGADRDKACGVQRVVPHVISRRLDILCSGVHTLLGDKVRFLPLGSLCFMALAGLGGGLILDNFNRDRKRQRWGWRLLCGGLLLRFGGLLLGLP